MTPVASSFTGLFPALVSPFSEDGSRLDVESLRQLIEFVYAGGATGVVACGSTGEAVTLTDSEYEQVVTTAVRASAGRGLCIAGAGASSTAKSVELAKRAEQQGAQAILLVTPPYNKPPQAGIIEHFRAVHAAVKLPIIAYNVPGRTAGNLLPATVSKMVAEGLIAGLKESSGNMDQVVEIGASVSDKIALLSGEDSLVVPTIAVGGRGVISVTGNVIPGVVSRMVASALAGDHLLAQQLQFASLPLTKLMFVETNPIPVKAALAIQGIIRSDSVRLPLLPASSETKAQLRSALSALEYELPLLCGAQEASAIATAGAATTVRPGAAIT